MTNAELMELIKQENPDEQIHLEMQLGTLTDVLLPESCTCGEALQTLFPDEDFHHFVDCKFRQSSNLRVLDEFWDKPYVNKYH